MKALLANPEKHASIEDVHPVPGRKAVLKATLERCNAHWTLVTNDGCSELGMLDRDALAADIRLDRHAPFAVHGIEVQQAGGRQQAVLEDRGKTVPFGHVIQPRVASDQFSG